jgi:hypothetical protein
MKQNPFSLYDFLGYFIPGLLFIFAIFLILDHNPSCFKSISSFLKSFPTLRLESIVFIVLISYALGHLLSFISSITIERYGVWKYGYPSKNLLSISYPKFTAHFKYFHGLLWGVIMMIFLFPVFILDLILGKWLGFKFFFDKPLEAKLAFAIKLKANILLNNAIFSPDLNEPKNDSNEEKLDYDFFRIFISVVLNYSKKVVIKFFFI